MFLSTVGKCISCPHADDSATLQKKKTAKVGWSPQCLSLLWHPSHFLQSRPNGGPISSSGLLEKKAAAENDERFIVKVDPCYPVGNIQIPFIIRD